MSLLEIEDRNMAEGVGTEPVAQKGKNVDDRDRYLESYLPKETPTVEERRNQRKPVWDILNDPGEMAVLKRRAFLEQLRQKTERGKGLQVAQLQWNEKKRLREERRQELLERQQESQTEIPKTPFFDKLKNIGKTISEFLSQPNKEAERLRRFETQSHEQLKETFKESGRKLRGLSGFLRGLGAATFAGSKEGILAGTKTFSAKMQENSKSQRGSRAGSAPPPITF